MNNFYDIYESSINNSNHPRTATPSTAIASTAARELAGLKEAMAAYQLHSGLILTENTEATEGAISVVPIWKWLLER